IATVYRGIFGAGGTTVLSYNHGPYDNKVFADSPKFIDTSTGEDVENLRGFSGLGIHALVTSMAYEPAMPYISSGRLFITTAFGQESPEPSVNNNILIEAPDSGGLIPYLQTKDSDVHQLAVLNGGGDEQTATADIGHSRF